MSALQQYKCHKVVSAAKVTAIRESFALSDHYELTIVGGGEEDTHVVTAEWFVNFSPVPGGYLVIYDDGYQSFSPAKAFEAGYELL